MRLKKSVADLSDQLIQVISYTFYCFPILQRINASAMGPKNKDNNEESNGMPSSAVESQSISKVPQRQSRLLSFLFSKKVPPILTEEERILYPESPKKIFQFLFFSWIVPVYRVGYKRTLDDTDIFKFPDAMTVELHYKRYSEIFDRRISIWKLKNPSKGNKWPLRILLMTVLETFFGRFILSALFSILFIAAISSSPMVNKALVHFVENRIYDRGANPIAKGIGLAILYGVLSIVQLISFAHTLDVAYKVGIDLKSVVIKHLFEKSMKLSQEERKSFPPSKITTLVGSDLARLEFAFSLGNMGLALLGGAIVAIGLLINNIGVSALPGIALLIVCISGQGVSTRKLYSYRALLNQFTDTRVAYIRELISSFKTIKFYCWEDPYFERIKSARMNEMSILLKMKIMRAAIETVSTSLPTVSTMISFLVLYKVRGVGDIASIFSSLSLFSILGMEISFVPLLLSTSSDAVSALNRTIAVLQCEKGEKEKEQLSPSSLDIAIELKDASFEWGEETDSTIESDKKKQIEEAYELQSQVSNISSSVVPIESILQDKFAGFDNVNLSIRKGDFVIVTGLIGSGKSSLLNALNGTMKKTSGSLATSGSMIFYDKVWIQNTTIKENIIFGLPFDEVRYKKVLFSCALIDDIKLLPGGDITEVGERGVTLSGGQKARINLARAVYTNRDIFLLDDVLSAVDAKVGEHIIKHCFLDLLKEKTRIVATHQLSLAATADKVIFLNKDGSFSFELFDLIKESNPEFLNLLSFNANFQTPLKDKGGKVEKDEQEEEEKEKEDEEPYNNEPSGPLMTKEKKAVDSLSWDVYKSFLTSGNSRAKGILLLLILLVCLVFETFTTQFINTWLSFWTENKFESLSAGTYIGIYVMFNILGIFFGFGQLAALSWVVNNASKSFFIGAVKALLFVPMAFMDTTPLGRILNRFTKDTDVLDNEIFQTLSGFLGQCTALVGALILTIVYLPWMAIAVPPLIIICALITDFSQSSGREIKRIEALRRSFVFNNINEALSGLSTIKAYGVEKMFIEKNNINMNRENESLFLTFVSQRWLALHLTICTACYSFLLAAIAASGSFHLSPSSTGLLLSSVLQFSDAFGVIFRLLMMIENSMNSAERLYQYSKQLEQEAPYKVSEYTPKPEWPSDPSIEFDHVSMAYRPGLPMVLREVSFKLNGKEKVGICGRTGAGKSSIMTALFRISELDEGKIIIDGLDIGKMGLKDLRSKLTIIPQDTMLFKGTIRYNLDPFGELPDVKLIDVLKKSGMVKAGEASKFELDLLVEEDGGNFSLGEKQLIALARALARNSNILILDEATSSVDYETDSKIQNTIKHEFEECTILCIAHRLRTILDYDKIIVLDAGEVKEFDTPYNLFSRKDGIFRQMCQSSNIVEEDFKT